eukprot:366264-Chlamydomonas_euryale.AAC.3
MAWHSMPHAVRHVTALHCMARRHGMARHGMQLVALHRTAQHAARHCTARRHGTARREMLRAALHRTDRHAARHGMVWHGMARHGMARRGTHAGHVACKHVAPAQHAVRWHRRPHARPLHTMHPNPKPQWLK